MENSRSKKAVAASLSLALALGSVPAVALADDEGQSDNSSEESQQRASYTFSANGGQFGSSDVANIEANEDGSVDAPTPTRSGYTFKGWYSTSNLDQIPESYQQYYKLDPSAPNGFTWFAAWEKSAESETPAESKAFEAQFVANGGAFADGSETLAAKADADGIVSQPATPTREGYTFAGWYWTSDLSQLPEDQRDNWKVDFSQPIDKTHTSMYAAWTKNEEQQKACDVMYIANGGLFADGQEFQQGVADSDGIMRQPAAPTREGYTFAGWYWTSDLSQLNDQQKLLYKVDFSQSVADKEHVTMYAAWTKNEEQAETEVLYAANGGTFADGNETMQGVADSDGIMRQPSEPTREGYTFAGWSWVSDPSQLPEDQRDNYKVDFSQSVAGKDHVTMYAQWTKNAEQNEYNVMYVANGGQFATGETFQQGVTDSDGIMRQPAAPTREGYTFDGWYWHADLSQLTEEQKQNEKVDFSQPVQSNVTIYAQWTKNEEQAEEITVNFVDNFNKTQNSVEINKGEAVAKPADPSYDGWEFEGWSSTLKDEQGNWVYTPVDFSKAVEDTDGDGVVTYYAFYNEAKADDNGNGNAATDKAATDESDAQGSDQQAADESSEAPQTGDATNAAAVAGIGGIAGLMAAAAALLRRRRNN